MDHRPALRSTDGKLVEWNEVPVADIQTVMSTYTPVCWDCYLAQSFRRDHPEMVVDRRGRKAFTGRALMAPGK